MRVAYIWEHNGNDTLLYADALVGAYARGASLDEALGKLPGEVAAYLRWRDETSSDEAIEPVLVQEKSSRLQIADADSDVLFDSERPPITPEEYEALKALVMKSARDVLRLYEAVPDKDFSALPHRRTFYGDCPRTAREMYEHVKNVNGYYFGESGVSADEEGDIVACRARAFQWLDARPELLANALHDNPAYGGATELWTLRKSLRRFVWHDRIHAKAMTRMARITFGPDAVPDVFRFEK